MQSRVSSPELEVGVGVCMCVCMCMWGPSGFKMKKSRNGAAK